MNVLQYAEQFRKALQMFAQSLTDDQALSVATVFDTWETNKNYKTGDFITYGVKSVGDPQLYKVVQDHSSQENWTPDISASLYSPLGLDDAGHPIWSQPTGSHDAYNAGDIVNFKGTLYESLIDGNTYSPDIYSAGWKVFVAE